MTELDKLKIQLAEERAARQAAEGLLATAQLVIQRREKRFLDIFERMQVGLVEVDNDGLVVMVSPAFCSLTGYSIEDLMGKSAVDVLATPASAVRVKKQKKFREQKLATNYESQIRRKDGTIIWVMISGAPVVNEQGKVVGSLGLHLDITESKKLQEELQTARELAVAAQKAETQFLANLSHELRTPVNAVLGMAHLLNERSPQEHQHELLESLMHSAELLRSLLSDVIDISNINAGTQPVRIDSFNLFDLLERQASSFRASIAGRPIEFKLKVDTKIENQLFGDPKLLNQILLNLLSTAEKFTTEGLIEINVQEISRACRRVDLLFEITDTGSGIPHQDIASIFQSSRTAADSYNGKYEGLGIGLAIIKKLVEQQGGSIEVETDEITGTRFCVYLSYMDSGIPLDAKVDATDQLEKSIEGLRVLVVEDNRINIQYLGNLLKGWKVTFEVALNGLEAVNKSKEQIFDIVLMDLQMPVMNGYEATREILRESNPNWSTPIIALTASALASEKKKAAEHGMVGFLTKPYTPASLLENLTKYTNGERRSLPLVTPEVLKGQKFVFSDHFDKAYLQTFYDGDIEYASEMFEMFLEEGTESLKAIREAVKAQNEEKTRSEIHKIKPAFSMIGFTKLWKNLEEFEHRVGLEISGAALQHKFASLDENIELSIIRAEVELLRMKEWIKKSKSYS